MVCPHHSAPEQPSEVRRIPFNFRGIAAIDTDPWSQLHALNSAPELFYSPELGGHWCAVRREVVVEVLRNADVFSSKQVRVPPLEREIHTALNGWQPMNFERTPLELELEAAVQRFVRVHAPP